MKKITILLALINFNLNAQDVHFSQFDKSNIIFNPSLIGSKEGDYKIGLQTRSQWSKVSVPFKTTVVFFEIKELIKNQSVELNFLYDIAGDSKLSSTGIILGTSRKFKTKETNKIRLGVQLGIYQRKADFSSLLFPQQQVIIIDKPFWFIDFSLGGSYIQKINKKTKITIGASTFHINKPNQSHLNNESLLPIRSIFHAELKHKINETYAVSPKTYYSTQAENKEFVFGTDFEYIVNTKKERKLKLKSSFFSRLKDALLIAIGVEMNGLTVMFNHDINTSSLAKASNYQGAREITIRYCWNKKNKKNKKTCPKYL